MDGAIDRYRTCRRSTMTGSELPVLVDALQVIGSFQPLQIDPLVPPSESGYSPLLVVIIAVIAAAGGGAFGASFGALPAFAFTGIMTIAGAVATAIGLEGAALTMYGAAFGPLFGPHVAFAGGAAAHAYAAKYQPELQEQEGWGYHNAKNILVPIGNHPKVLAVGAAFGAGGQLLKMGTDFVTGPSASLGFAHIAWVVVASAFVHRAAFGYPLMGDREKVASRVGSRVEDTSWLSFDRDEAEPHLPWQFAWTEVLILGGFVGLISGYITILTGSPWLTFGISAATLLFLCNDYGLRPETLRAGTPVTHQITLPSAVAAHAVFFQMQNPPINPLVYAMFWALVFGVLGEFFRELTERYFYAWGDTHLDPPAFSITITVILLVILSILGIIGAPNAYQVIEFHWF